MSRQTRSSLRQRVGQGASGRFERLIGAMARRMRVSSTSAARWVLGGFSDSAGSVESAEAENFPGIGFAARPSSGDNAEVVAIKVGGESGHQVIVATRNHDVLKGLIASEGLEEDETAIFTGASMVKISANGDIEIGNIGGTRQPLATKSDIDALAAIVQSHVHITTATIGTGGPGAIAPTTSVVPSAVCTTKLKAE